MLSYTKLGPLVQEKMSFNEKLLTHGDWHRSISVVIKTRKR